MKRKDLLVLLCVLALGAALYFIGGGRLGAADNGESAYLRIETPNGEHSLVALDSERDIELTGADGQRNVVHIFPGGFYMLSASCDNQDCLKQGEVTLQNRASRPLFDKVVCLPNKVVLTLVTEAEEPAERLELAP